MAQKRPNLVQNPHFGHFGPNKLGFLAQKTAKLSPNICIFGNFWPNIGPSEPFGATPDQKNNANEVHRLISDMWRAGCISQDTYLLYTILGPL